MSNRNRRILISALLSLCLCLSLLTSVPVRASADGIIEKVLCSLNFEPVVMMELQYINVSTSSTNCVISSAFWTDANGNQVTGQFGKGDYTLNVNYDPNPGFVFSPVVAGYINNNSGGVTVSVAADGSAATLRKTYTAIIWTPTSIKDPYDAKGEYHGWVSFAVSSMYAESHEWFLVSPDGSQTMPAAQAEAAFAYAMVDVTGEDTERLNIYNLPGELDGWKVFCRHWSVDHTTFKDSKTAKIIVTNVPTPEPTIEITPVPLTVPTAAPEVTEPPEPEPAVEATPAPTVKPHEHDYHWEHDAEAHWRVCDDCGEVGAREPHLFVWHETRPATADQIGEETGVCSICGYTLSRTISNGTNAASSTRSLGEKIGLSGFSDAQIMVAGGAGVCVLLLLLTVLFNPKRRR